MSDFDRVSYSSVVDVLDDIYACKSIRSLSIVYVDAFEQVWDNSDLAILNDAFRSRVIRLFNLSVARAVVQRTDCTSAQYENYML